jgi:hypothetical protein
MWHQCSLNNIISKQVYGTEIVHHHWSIIIIIIVEFIHGFDHETTELGHKIPPQVPISYYFIVYFFQGTQNI